jgi:hypothetical protein
MLNRARKAGVDAPCVFFIDEQSKLLYMEKIDGITAKQYIWDHAKTGLQPTGTQPIYPSTSLTYLNRVQKRKSSRLRSVMPSQTCIMPVWSTVT